MTRYILIRFCGTQYEIYNSSDVVETISVGNKLDIIPGTNKTMLFGEKVYVDYNLTKCGWEFVSRGGDEERWLLIDTEHEFYQNPPGTSDDFHRGVRKYLNKLKVDKYIEKL